MSHFKVVYSKYDNFYLSNDALKLYREKCEAAGIDPTRDLNDRCNYVNRSNQYLIETIEELGQKACGRKCKLHIKSFPLPFKNYFIIKYYNGWEDVEINYRQYLLDKYGSLNLENLSDFDCREILQNLVNTINSY